MPFPFTLEVAKKRKEIKQKKIQESRNNAVLRHNVPRDADPPKTPIYVHENKKQDKVKSKQARDHITINDRLVTSTRNKIAMRKQRPSSPLLLGLVDTTGLLEGLEAPPVAVRVGHEVVAALAVCLVCLLRGGAEGS